jgi:hypothetical protein
MKKLEGLKMLPTLAGEATAFKGLSGKVATSVTLPDLTTEWSAELIQDFNAIGYVAASRISTPTITTPGGGTLSRQAVFTLNPDGADTVQYLYRRSGATRHRRCKPRSSSFSRSACRLSAATSRRRPRIEP